MLSGIFYCDIQFFRFYKDGVFLDCLIKGIEEPTQATQIRHWFQREQLLNGVVQGSYIFKDKKITFSTPGHYGGDYSIDYEGKYEKDCLILNSLNHNTGRKVTNQIFTRLVKV
jgi:hypothetical protein